MRISARVLALALVVSGVTLLVPAEANAVAPIWTITESTGSVSFTQGSAAHLVTATCPVGSVAVSGYVTQSLGDDLRRQSEYVAQAGNNRTYQVYVDDETGGSATNTVTAHARCVPASYFSGTETSPSTTFSTNATTHLSQGTVSCPGGYKALSASVAAGTLGALLTSTPTDDFSGWSFRAWLPYSSSTATLTVECIPTAEFSGMRAYSNLDTVGWGAAANADCPSGMMPITGGTSHTGGDNQAISINVHPTSTGWSSTTESLDTGYIRTVVLCLPSSNPVVSMGGSSGPTSSSNATFSFSVSDPAAVGDYSLSVACRFTDAGSVGSWNACSSPVSRSGLGEGEHLIEVRATTGDGRSTIGSRSVTVDTQGPTVLFTSPQDRHFGPNFAADLSFAVADATAVPTLQCAFDSGSWGACAGSTLSDYRGSRDAPHSWGADGSHVLHVQALDSVGNVGTSDLTFVYDGGAPVITFDDAPGVAVGSSPVFGFTIDDLSTIRNKHCYVDSHEVTCASDTPEDLRGHGTATPTGLADGSHSLMVSATDDSLNATNATLSFVVDTAAPTVSFADPTGVEVGTDHPQFTFQVADRVAVPSLECTVDGGLPADCGLSGDEDQRGEQVASVEPLADGQHVLHVALADIVGNNAIRDFAFVTDTSAPTVTFSQPTGLLLATPSPTLVATMGDATAVVSLACSLDGGDAAPCSVAPASDYRGEQAFALEGLDDGDHVLAVTATDHVGHASSSSMTFAIDTTGPSVDFDLADQSVLDTASPVVGIAPDDVHQVVSLACAVDSGAFSPCDTAEASDYRSHRTLAFSEVGTGQHVLHVRATDEVGNSATHDLTVFIDLDAAEVTFQDAPGRIWSLSSPTLEFQVADATDVVSLTCSIDSASMSACQASELTDWRGSRSFAAASLTDGARTLHVRAVDAAGHVTVADLAFVVDTEAPTVVFADAAGHVFSSSSPTIAMVVSDASSVGTLECSLDGGGFAACPVWGASDYRGNRSLVLGGLSDGSHVIAIRPTDAAGNKAATSLTFTVDTTRPPTTTPPGSVVTVSGVVVPKRIKAKARAVSASFLAVGGPATAVNGHVKVFDGSRLIGEADVVGGKVTVRLKRKLRRGKHTLTFDLAASSTSNAAKVRATTRVV